MIQTRTVYFSEYGVPKTGLTLTWESIQLVSDGSAVSPQPTFTEIGGGFYKFDVDVPLSNGWAGVIDGGVVLTDDMFRYIPVVAGSNDIDIEECTFVTPQYDEDSDTLQFVVFLLINGKLFTTPTSVSISVYDTTHTLQFTEVSSSPTNGVFILAKTAPGLNNMEAYYVTASVVADGATFVSAETMITLD